MNDQPALRPASTSSLAIVSLIFGISAWCMLPVLGAIVAIVCGHVALSEIRHCPADAPVEGNGLAIAGLILGYLQLLLGLAVMAILFAVLFFGVALHFWS